MNLLDKSQAVRQPWLCLWRRSPSMVWRISYTWTLVYPRTRTPTHCACMLAYHLGTTERKEEGYPSGGLAALAWLATLAYGNHFPTLLSPITKGSPAKCLLWKDLELKLCSDTSWVNMPEPRNWYVSRHSNWMKKKTSSPVVCSLQIAHMRQYLKKDPTVNVTTLETGWKYVTFTPSHNQSFVYCSLLQKINIYIWNTCAHFQSPVCKSDLRRFALFNTCSCCE